MFLGILLDFLLQMYNVVLKLFQRKSKRSTLRQPRERVGYKLNTDFAPGRRSALAPFTHCSKHFFRVVTKSAQEFAQFPCGVRDELLFAFFESYDQVRAQVQIHVHAIRIDYRA